MDDNGIAMQNMGPALIQSCYSQILNQGYSRVVYIIINKLIAHYSFLIYHH